MSEIYDYRTIRVERAAWRRVVASVQGAGGDAVRAAGGTVFGLFSGLIGLASDEGVLIIAWPAPEALVAHAGRTAAAVDGVIESSGERLVATVRPIDATPPREAGVYAHRWFWLQAQDWPEFLRLSEEGVWPYFESDGCRIVGLWRSMEPGPLAKVLLITRYPSVAHWERTRLQSPQAPEGADERLYAAAQQAGRRRAELTERSIVRLTRIAGGQ
ncbi:MAG TPA: NIPSNAP family protein [Methylomirabilota bacterium]|nr:NIPSNAP family protein [Methylomirabilota bacterium]